MLKELSKEFKKIVWPKKSQVINDLTIVSVIAIVLMAIVIFMDSGTQFIFEQIATHF